MSCHAVYACSSAWPEFLWCFMQPHPQFNGMWQKPCTTDKPRTSLTCALGYLQALRESFGDGTLLYNHLPLPHVTLSLQPYLPLHN
jgi:hypothetical protein